MLGDDFWVNLRTAVHPVIPTVHSDSVNQEDGDIEQMLQSATTWLVPGAVEDFEPQDFAFLAPADLERLVRNVETFRRIANEAQVQKPLPPHLLQEATAAFAEIIRLLRPHKFPYCETFMLQYRLERELSGKLPPWIEGFFCEIGTDVAEDPALWVWLNVSQEAAEKELVVTEGQQVRDIVVKAIRRLRITRWPYVRFQSLDELAAMKGRRRRTWRPTSSNRRNTYHAGNAAGRNR